jgi:hypothetical protein
LVIAVDHDDFFLQGIRSVGSNGGVATVDAAEAWGAELGGAVAHAREVLEHQQLVLKQGYILDDDTTEAHAAGRSGMQWLFSPTVFGREMFAYACGFPNKERLERQLGAVVHEATLPSVPEIRVGRWQDVIQSGPAATVHGPFHPEKVLG